MFFGGRGRDLCHRRKRSILASYLFLGLYGDVLKRESHDKDNIDDKDSFGRYYYVVVL